MTTTPSDPVQHDPAQQRFFITLGAQQALLNYALRQDVMDIYHVFVPAEHRGGGWARALTLAACEFARANHLKIQPTCPYVRHAFLPRHPHYQALQVGAPTSAA